MILVIVVLFMETPKLVHGERRALYYNVRNLEVRRNKKGWIQFGKASVY